MKNWHKLKPELFKKQPYYLPGCDTSETFLRAPSVHSSGSVPAVSQSQPTEDVFLSDNKRIL
jgi:hypothetical protein